MNKKGAAAAMLLISVFCGADPATFDIMGVGDLPGGAFMSAVRGMSADGTMVVGYSRTAAGWEAFRWKLGDEQPVRLDDGRNLEKNADSRALDASWDGSKIVGYSKDAGGYNQAVVWVDETPEFFPRLDGYPYSYSAGYAISDDGSRIAIHNIAQDPLDGNAYKGMAHIWNHPGTGAVLLPLYLVGPDHVLPPHYATGSLPMDLSGDGSVAVGLSQIITSHQHVFWNIDSLAVFPIEPYPEAHGSYPRGVSVSGTTIVGERFTDIDPDPEKESFDYRAFRMRPGGSVEILKPLIGDDWSTAEKVSGDGRIVVGASGTRGSGGRSIAVLWDEDGKVYQLSDLIMKCPGASHWNALTRIYAIDNDGDTIAGTGDSVSGPEGFVVDGLDPDDLDNPLRYANPYGGGICESAFFGWFWRAGKSHIFHYEHGWQYVAGSTPESMYTYDHGLNCWTWTSEAHYPYLYKYGTDTDWMLYYKGGKPGDRWFFHFGHGQWMSEDQLAGG